MSKNLKQFQTKSPQIISQSMSKRLLRPTTTTCMTTLLVVLLTVSSVNAVPIPADLSFNGEFGLDLYGGGSRATQSGTFYVRQNGVDTLGTYQDQTLTTGNNPIFGTPQQHGGGIVGNGDGFGGTASASISANNDGWGDVFADTDLGDNGQTLPLLITNNSFSQGYWISFSLSFQHEVNASGPDAYLRSDIEVHLNNSKLFESEILSDTLFGNEIDGIATDDFGGLVSDMNQFIFEFFVAPQDSAVVELDYTLEGLEFDPLSGVLGNGNYFLSLDNVQAQVPVPEPGTAYLALVGMACGLLSYRHRRSYN